MEQHNENDPRGDDDPTGGDGVTGGDDARDTDEAWRQVARSWSDIGDRLKDRYREVVGDTGPSEDEVRGAVKTLGTAVQAVFDSLGSAMRDPAVRSQMKEAAAEFASAVGQTFNDLGEEIRRTPDSDKWSRMGGDDHTPPTAEPTDLA